MPETKEWTVMFYLASDNPLAPGTIAHLKAIKNAGYHPEANVLAQFDPHTVNMPVHIFDVNRIEKLRDPDGLDIGFRANDPFVRNLVADKLWDAEVNQKIEEALRDRIDYKAPAISREMSREQDPKKSLALFLDFCRKEYPARHYMLFLIGHGLAVGNDLFLFDEHGAPENGNSGPRSLLLTELSEVLDQFNRDLNKDGQLELLGFHSCSMSGAEVAFQLKGKAHYMLAAQGPSYVGSWPYRQILLRLFNALNSSKPFTEQDLGSTNLVDKLKTGEDPVSTFIRGRFNGNGGGKLLSQHRIANRPEADLVKAVVSQFEGLLTEPKLFEQLQQVELSEETSQLIAMHQKNPFSDERLRQLNRLLLIDAYPQEIPRVNIKEMLISIFHYCLYNSFDFQLAGYSCDLTLCDLSQVGDLQRPVANLVSHLIEGLESSKEPTNDPLIRDLVILAHWDAQSFYEEKYTDLYDFCFRLKYRCAQAKPSSETTKGMLNKIGEACLEIMKKLKRGQRGDDDGVIVRCEFCGPAYQYVHGLSVFFPWSEPVGDRLWDEQYSNFEFRKTNWHEFLNRYFTETMRKPQEEEVDDLDTTPPQSTFDTELLELLQEITTKTFNDDGQLKGGGRDPLGPPVKGGGQDPAGSDCDCGSIKNYPHVTRRRFRRGAKGSRPVINLAKSFEKAFPRKT